MSDTADISVLKRKLAPPRSGRMPGGSAVEALLRQTMPRDADRLLGLDMVVTSVNLSACDKTALLEKLGPHDLIFLMTRDAGSPGLCVVSPGVLATLIEVQMSGRVTSAPPVEREPTRTDGIVVSDIVDRWLSTAVEQADAIGLGETIPLAGFLRADGILDARATDLALDPCQYRLLTASLSFSNGNKTGQIWFALPEGQAAGAASGASENAARMRGHLLSMEAALRVVLHRQKRSIQDVRALKVDEVLEVPIDALRSVRLEALDGQLVARGRLGQMDDRKAVRIAREGGGLTAAQTKADFSVAEGGDAPAAMPGPAEPAAMATPALEEPGADVGAGGMPDLPDLPDLPDMPELPDLPDLPDLPELPDLP